MGAREIGVLKDMDCSCINWTYSQDVHDYVLKAMVDTTSSIVRYC